MKPASFVAAVEALADECDATVPPAAVEEWERLLRATSRIVLWEFEGLAELIRAVNNTPRPVPIKPAPKPAPPKDPKGAS